MGNYPIKGVLGSGFPPSLSLSLSLRGKKLPNLTQQVKAMKYWQTFLSLKKKRKKKRVLANIARLSSVAVCWVNTFSIQNFWFYYLTQGNL